MSNEYPKLPLPKGVSRIPTKEEALADGIEKEFLKRRKMLGGVKEASKKLPGPIGKGVALGVLGVEAASEGLKKLRSMEGRDAEPEIPSEVEGKSKGGSIMARGNKLARMKPTKMY